ncbi:hypothetical protein U9M48_041187 [Paspalum notatum var. saurae]|uniref:Uncharacterized protein n=1 Tax=Paspalum notatum var. saurae TaxID=547442 RepID=A0AAQ3UPT2_PASNO
MPAGPPPLRLRPPQTATRPLRLTASAQPHMFEPGARVLWAMWKTRNKRSIENNFMINTVGVMYASVANLQNWRPLLRQQEQGEMEKMIEKMRSWLENFPTNAVLTSDVGELG